MNSILSVRTHFSIKESIVDPSDIGQLAKEAGYDALGIVDTMSINGLVDVSKSCKKAGVKPIIGCRLAIYDDPSLKQTKAEAKVSEDPNVCWYATVYVKNEEGMKSLIKTLSRANEEDYFYYTPRTGLNELIALLKPGNLLFTTGDFNGLFSHKRYADIANKILSEIDPLNALFELVPIDTPLYEKSNKRALDYSVGHPDVGVIAAKPVFYAKDEDADSLDVLNGVISNTPIDNIFFKKPYIRSSSLINANTLIDDCESRFGATLATEISANIERVTSECIYEWDEMPMSLPKMAPDEMAELISLVKKGWAERLTKPVLGHQPTDLAPYKDRLSYELSVLKKMGFEGYFLLVSDIIRWSKENDIKVGPGRGSCAGSLVAYLLHMTDLDPIRFNLIFERFINPERIDLPDVDIDFASSQRAEVIDYIKRRYGEDNVAGISNYVTLGSASSLRDISRIYNLSPLEVSCSKLMPKEHGEMIDLEVAASMVPEIEKFKHKHGVIWNHAVKLTGRLRNYGKHAAGIVIAGEPVKNRAVIERRSGEMVTNWDRNSVEKWGLIKVDILGLSTLDILDIVIESVKKSAGVSVDLLSIPLDDEKTLDLFTQGRSIGVFQFESAGIRHLLKELGKYERLTFDDITAATALFRPGPIDAGLMDDYIQIKQGADPYYDHSSMENALKDTGGVIIYQEQVMQLARDVAGFAMPEADKLRKIVGKKQKDEMAEMRDKWVQGCVDTSEMSEREANNLFDKIEKFAGYGFNKSHAAAYSVISYWAMWFKAHYPLDFFAASMSVLKEDKMPALLKDANASGIDVLPPDINISSNKFEIIESIGERSKIVIPFNRIKGLSDISAKVIVKAREDNGGKFDSISELESLVDRRRCNSRTMTNLDKVGAFASIVPGSLPASHPDRLKDQLELMPGLCSNTVYVDRLMPRDSHAMNCIRGIYMEARQCENCSLAGGAHPTPAFGKKPRIMIITDCPSKSEDDNNKLMTGDGAKFVKWALQDNGFKLNDCYFTTLVKSQKIGKALSNEQINACSAYLDREIEALEPSTIVLLGNSVTRYLLPGEKKPKDAFGKIVYSKELDANLVIGMNPAMIWFDSDKQNDLNDLFAKVADLL